MLWLIANTDPIYGNKNPSKREGTKMARKERVTKVIDGDTFMTKSRKRENGEQIG